MRPRRPVPSGRRTNPLHLVWVPLDGDDAGRIGTLLGLDAYDARRIERSRTPRRLRSFGDADDAAEMHARAGALGLRTFVIDEHSLDSVPPAEPVRRVRRAGDGIVLSSDSTEVNVREDGIDLLVTARVAVRRQRVTSRISMLSSETGATPGMPRVVKGGRQVSDHPGVLDLYPADREVCLRAREEAIDFSGFDAGPPSALLHFSRLLDEVRRAAPDAAFDDRFARFDDQDAAHAGRTEVRPGITVLDGVGRFARYSRILWHARREFGWRPD